MKKVLLLSAAVCMALTMSAQKLPTTENATLSVNKTLVAPTNYAQSYAKKVIAQTVQPKVAPAKVAQMPTLGSLTGLYICDNTEEGDGTITYTKSKGFSMEQLEDIVILEGGTEEEPVNYNCNVLINDLMVKGNKLYAVYDEEEGTLTIPSSQNPEFDNDNYNFYFVNLMSMNDEEKVEMSFAIPVVLEVEEDDNGFYFANNSGYLGFGIVAANSEGQLVGFAGTAINDVAFTPCNYLCEEEERHAMKDESSKFELADPYGVFIEKIDDTTYAVHGFMEMGTVRVTVDEEGHGLMETLQPMAYEQIDNNGTMAYLGAIKWEIGSDGYINVNPSAPYLECGFYTFTSRDEEGNVIAEYPNCFALYNDAAPEGITPWVFYSLGAEGVDGGFAPLYAYSLFMPIEHPALEGIKTATATRVNPATVNLAGQRVKEANGIVIENSKKVIR